MDASSLAFSNLSRVLGRLPTPAERKRFRKLVDLARVVPDGDSKMLASFGAAAFKAFPSSRLSRIAIADIAEEALLEAWQLLNPLPPAHKQHLLAGISAASAKSKTRARKRRKKSSPLPKLIPAHNDAYDEILKELKNRGRSHSQLSKALNTPPATLTRRIRELKADGKVKSNRKFGGYYRPDCPPEVTL